MTETDEQQAASPATLRRLALGAVAATIILTAAAFWLSYAHLHTVASLNGLAGVRAWAWPATVDLFIVIGETLLLVASLSRRVDYAAVGLTVIGSGGSIALNVAGVGSDASAMTYIVAAVPPVAALFAFGALMRQFQKVLLRNQTEPDTEPIEVPVQGPGSMVPAGTGTLKVPAPEPKVQPMLEPGLAQVEPPAEPEPRNPAEPLNLNRRTPKRPKAKTERPVPESAAQTPSVMEQVRQILDLIEAHGYDTVKLKFVQEQTGLSKTTAYNRLIEARTTWAEEHGDAE